MPTLPVLFGMSKWSSKKPVFSGLAGVFVAAFCVLSPAHAVAAANWDLFSAPPARDWQRVLQPADIDQGPLAKKLLTWFYVTETKLPADPKELIRFTLENSGWPRLHEFRKRIEKDMGAFTHPHEIAAWFDQNPPKTAEGLKAYIGALVRLGQADKANTVLRNFWLTADLDKGDVSQLNGQFKKMFSATDHADRLDNLLWEMRYKEAEDMLPLVDADRRKLASARIALGRLSSKAPNLVGAVPAALQNDAGLLFDRLRWRRQMNKDEDAWDILRHAPNNLVHAEAWWKERNILARRAIEDKKYSRAYKIIANHGLAPGVEYSQAEWMMGWLSLRFLNQPDKAYQHFDRFYQAVTSAVSRSRATYWLARASEALHQQESANNWYKLGAQFPSTFYGQISYEKIYGPMDAQGFLSDQVPPETTRIFEGQELVQVVRFMSRNGLSRYAPPFFVKLLEKAKDRTDFILIAKLARETRNLYFTVEANKQLQQKLGSFMFTEGYPLLSSVGVKKPEKALIHAIVHRESMFDSRAASSAGARGLMQLMPATAKHVSKNIGRKFAVDQLTENPKYNVELGANYLQSLLDKYDGYYPFAIAAYNAGPGNVNQWIEDFGDPRNGKVGIIDWIELIPIYETRNYVQRVMESYYMYKLRLSETPKTVIN